MCNDLLILPEKIPIEQVALLCDTIKICKNNGCNSSNAFREICLKYPGIIYYLDTAVYVIENLSSVTISKIYDLINNIDCAYYIITKPENNLKTQFNSFSDDIKNNRILINKLIDNDELTKSMINNIHEKHYEFILSKRGKYIEYINSPSSKHIAIAVKSHGTALLYGSDDNRNNKEIVLMAIANNGLMLECVNPSLKDDHYVVMVAVKQNYEAIKFASDRILSDPAIMSEMMDINPLTFKFAQNSAKKDIELCKRLLLFDYTFISCIPHDIILQIPENYITQCIRRGARLVDESGATASKCTTCDLCTPWVEE
jgi:hypothetical protein